MNSSHRHRRPIRRRTLFRRRGWGALGAVLAATLVVGVAVAVPLHFPHLPQTPPGIRAPAQFLVHWQQVASESGTVPTPAPFTWSGTVGAPSRLPRFSGTDAINAGTAGHVALVWVFNETVGVATSAEMELTFHIVYTVGAVTTSVAITSFIETQRRAPAGPLTFTVVWDSGHTTGVTFVSQLEVTQACLAVGTCP